MPSRRSFALSMALAAVGAPAAFAQNGRPRSYDMIGAAAPAFALPMFGGAAASLSDYSGRVLVLLFGGLWCPDCIVDGPHTNRFAALAQADPDIDFLYVQSGPGFGRWNNVGRTGATLEVARQAWTRYFDETGYQFPVAFDLSRNIALARSYAIEWFPTFLIIDPSGVIRGWRLELGVRGVDPFLSEARRFANGS